MLGKVSAAWQIGSRGQVDSNPSNLNNNRHLLASAIARLSLNKALLNATLIMQQHRTKTTVRQQEGYNNLVLALILTLIMAMEEALVTKVRVAGRTTEVVVKLTLI